MTVTTAKLKGSLNQGRLIAHLIASSENFQAQVGAKSQLAAMDHIHVNEALEEEFGETPPFAIVLEQTRNTSWTGTTGFGRSGTADIYFEFVYERPDGHLEWLNTKSEFANTISLILGDMTTNLTARTEDPLNPGYSYIQLTSLETTAAPTWESLAESGRIEDPDSGIVQKIGCWQQIAVSYSG